MHPEPFPGPDAPPPIKEGDAVVITGAWGDDHLTTALSGIEQDGHSFPLVWVNRPLNDGGFEPMPWPAESVRHAGADQ